MNPRIVCAALHNEYVTIMGIRHYDLFMRNQIRSIREDHLKDFVQGFVDQFAKFYTRQEAWIVAKKECQILRRVGGDTKDGGTLYSENLY